jgi:integration host factor subunit alpha
MTKADLVSAISEQTDLSKNEASDVLEELLGIIKATLESEEEVKVSGFGKFEVKRKSERRGRNPQTGEDITIDSRKVVTFRPSGILKDRMNEDLPRTRMTQIGLIRADF